MGRKERPQAQFGGMKFQYAVKADLTTVPIKTAEPPRPKPKPKADLTIAVPNVPETDFFGQVVSLMQGMEASGNLEQKLREQRKMPYDLGEY